MWLLVSTLIEGLFEKSFSLSSLTLRHSVIRRIRSELRPRQSECSYVFVVYLESLTEKIIGSRLGVVNDYCI